MVHKILGGIPENQLVYGVKARTLTSQLTYYDTIFVVTDCGDVDRNEWKSMKDLLLQLSASTLQLDTDGPSLLFTHSTKVVKNSKDGDDFSEAISSVKPAGTSYIGKKLKGIIDDFNTRSQRAQQYSADALANIKPLNLVVITDGDFEEEPDEVIQALKPALDTARGIPPADGVDRRVGIQFVQVGDDDDATASLKKIASSLPKEENVIDTVIYKSTLDTDLLYRILLGAIDNRVWKATHVPETTPLGGKVLGDKGPFGYPLDRIIGAAWPGPFQASEYQRGACAILLPKNYSGLVTVRAKSAGENHTTVEGTVGGSQSSDSPLGAGDGSAAGKAVAWPDGSFERRFDPGTWIQVRSWDHVNGGCTARLITAFFWDGADTYTVRYRRWPEASQDLPDLSTYDDGFVAIQVAST